MDATNSLPSDMSARDLAITQLIARERARLRNFIRRRVADRDEAEDLMQDVLSEFVQAYRLPEPIEQIGAWMYRVARNRITDLFRKQKPELLADIQGEDDEDLGLDDILPAMADGPEEVYGRSRIMDAILAALEELPPEQREAFIQHELEGVSFKDMAEESGLSINTLLARKRYAILHLRARLQPIYDELKRE